MKIGVFGSTQTNEKILKQAEEIGKIIADNNHIVVTGGCDGSPHIVALSALKNGGEVVAYAVGKNIHDHKRYHVDLKGYTKVIYQEDYFLEELSNIDNYVRSLRMCQDIDAAVIIGGRVGTMYEVTILSGMSKDFYVLENSGGVTRSAIKYFVKEGHKSDSRVDFIGSPEELTQYLK